MHRNAARRRFGPAVATGVALIFGLIAGQTNASAQAPTGTLQLCKISDPANPVTGNFTFTIQGTGVAAISRTVAAGPAPGICTGPIQLPAGPVTIVETERTGIGVNLITAEGRDPATGAILNRLVSSNLQTRTAVATIVAGNISTQTIVTFRNATIPTGVLQICKQTPVGGFPAGTPFQFTVSGLAQTFTAPVGACTGPITVQAGSVTVTEILRTDADLIGITADPAGRLVSVDLPNRRAIVTVVAGGVSTQTIVTFTNRPRQIPMGELKLCKIAGTGVQVGTPFAIQVVGPTGTVSYTVPAGPAAEGGFCVRDGVFPVGTVVTVREVIPADFEVQAIAVSDGRGGTPNLTTGTVSVTIGTGVTEVAFTNRGRIQPLGELKLCKIAGPGIEVGTNFTIRVTDPRTGVVTSYAVPAGPAAEGGFCVRDGLFPVGTVVTVQEVVPAGIEVSSIAVSDGRGGTPNLATGTVSATIGSGVTEVAFTNRMRQLVPLLVCKVAGAGVTVGTNFTFTFSGGVSPAIVVPAGPAPGTCSAAIQVLAGTTVTVTEQNTTGFVVTPSASQTITITAPGPNRVTFTNARNNQGCSPGFFKNHLNNWVGLNPSALVGSVFTNPNLVASLRGETLLQAIQGGGGPGIAGAQEILLRAAIVALLNANNPGVGYPLTAAQIIGMVNDALNSNNRNVILTLADTLDRNNNLGCSLSGDNTTGGGKKK